MTPQTILVRHPLRVENLSDLMRLVTINARRKNVGLFFPQLPFDHFAMDWLNLRMAFRAGCSDVSPRDGGGGIRMGEYRVRSVTRGAVRSNDQPFAEKPFAVNALRIVFENMILVNGTLEHDRRAFSVTLPAEERHLEHSNARARIRCRQDIVGPVTILAQRSQRISFRNGFSVQRLCVEFLLLRVTRSAVDSSELFLVRKFFPLNILVARDAGKRAVLRSAEILLIHENRDCLPLALSRQGFVVVTTQTIAILLGEGRSEGKSQECNRHAKLVRPFHIATC
jgi:hypothetical protein